MNRNILLIFFFVLNTNCNAQRNIFYTFEAPVIDSLKNGINEYTKLLKLGEKDLKFYVIIIEGDNEFEIYLQEYSDLPKSGFLDLIHKTNRKLKIKKSLVVPIIFPSDINSVEMKNEKIAAIPLSGYYVKVVYDNYKQRVIKTANLY